MVGLKKCLLTKFFKQGQNVTWKEVLRQLEHKKDWDTAIEFMQHIIHDNPDDMDAYIDMNYLLMNLLVEEDHNNLGHDLDYYARLAKYYFDSSYAKYCDNPEYLFYTGNTAVMSEWYFGIDFSDAIKMLKKAAALEPNNLLYKWVHIGDNKNESERQNLATLYAKSIFAENSTLKDQLLSKGALGEYLYTITAYWARRFLEGNPL